MVGTNQLPELGENVHHADAAVANSATPARGKYRSFLYVSL
jgi:hypothetical protein